ncbi:MAG: arsenate reductase ArsC [Methanotrichaceae archaeon]
MASHDQDKMKILFICYHNSARSQMAEGLLRALYGNRYEAYSAGIEASQVDPRAVKVMNEIGIDISGQHSKRMDEYRGILFDLAVTVCDKAKEACPICGISLKAPATAPAAKRTIHKTFKDPAIAEGSEEEQLNVFRQVRDEIKSWIEQTFK